ncbi:xylose isomerase [Clostridia bacterium]|nr:xylose isomerase [Clostridia bacterium]
MKLAIFNPILYHMTLEESLKYMVSLGVKAMELGCGGYPGTKHADVSELYKDADKRKRLQDTFAKYGVEIVALSVHGNPVHPDRKTADTAAAELDQAITLAHQMNVPTVVGFSGCPGDGVSKCPNWVTCAWPTEFGQLLEWQWNEVLIPFWKAKAKAAADAKVRIAIEMHPGFTVHNPSSMMRLRRAAGDAVGANFDPSHLIWQGVNVAEAVKYLKGAIHHVHAKDTMFNENIKAYKGVLDTDPYEGVESRSWFFRSVGYGAGDFKGLISSLRMTGYGGPVSIEHEDPLYSPQEGLERAVRNLQGLL